MIQLKYDGTGRAQRHQRYDEAVLKITTVRENPKPLRVHLCGQFTGEYVSELEKTMSENIDAEKLALDLSNVTFVDREAMMFLCGARSRNISIENIPSYVMRWIEQEGRCGSSHFKPPEI
jgi:anti-anti-sigma regulatory factor